MATTATRRRTPADWHPVRRIAAARIGGWETALATVVAAGLGIVIVVSQSSPTAIASLTRVAGIIVAGWLVLTTNLTRAFIVYVLYLGLVDGYLKLRTGSDSITLSRDLLLYLLCVGVLARSARSNVVLDLPKVSVAVIGLLGLAVVEVANPHGTGFVHSLAGTRPHIAFLPLVFFGYYLMRSRRALRAGLVILVVVAAANGVVSIVQVNLTPSQLASWGPGYAKLVNGVGVAQRTFTDANGDVKTRPPALGSDSGAGGIAGMIAIPGAVVLLMLARRRATWRPVVLVGLAALAVAAVVTCQSRSAVVGSVAALTALVLLLIVTRPSRAVPAVVLIGGAVALTVAIATSGAKSGGDYRYASIAPDKAVGTAIDYRKSTIKLIPTYMKDYPLGAGLGSVGPAAGAAGGSADRDLNGESEFTALLIELGVPGLLLVIGIAVATVVTGIRAVRWQPDDELKLLLAGYTAAFAAVVGLFVSGAILFGSPGAPFFWFTVGVLAYWGSRPGRRRVAGAAGLPAAA